MDDYIDVIDENGVNSRIEILDIFNVEGYDNDYILYTKNIELDNENIEAYVSILKEDENSFSLLNIDNDDEWSIVQHAVLEMEY